MTTKPGILSRISFSALVVFLFFLVTHKVYHLPFSYGDDHFALAMVHNDKVPESYKASFFETSPNLKGILTYDTYIGRFRPLSWAYEKTLSVLFSDNTFLWRISNLIVLFFSAFFLRGIFSLLNVDSISRCIVLLLYVFGRNNESWWTLIPPAQNIGECLLLAGVYVWILYRKRGVTGFYIFPAVIFLLAALGKESFIFCIPVVLLADYFFLNPVRKLFSKEYICSALASFIPFMGLFITILHIRKVYAYPYQDTLSTILIYNLSQFIIASVFFLAPLVIVALGRKTISKSTMLKAFIVTIAWLFIQLGLLKGIKMDDQHHYLIPGLLLPLTMTAISLTEIRKLSIKIFYVLNVFYLLVIAAFVWNTYTNSSSYSASLQAYYKMLDEVKRQPANSIVYLSDNACIGDWIGGTSLILSNMGVNTEIKFCSTVDSVPEWEKEYSRNFVQKAFKRIPFDSSLFRPDGKWILLVEEPAKNGFINDNISLFKRDSKAYLKVDNKEFKIPGQYFYFSMPYQGWSLGELLKENFASQNYKGFYAIKLDNRDAITAPMVKM